MTVQAADALPLLEAELLGKWTYQQNQGVIAALKKENKDLKALLAQLPSNKSGKVAVEAELRELDLQANSLRKQHDKLVQDRLSSASRLAQLRDSLKDLNTDSQLVFQESPGSRLVKQLQQKLAVALTKHDAAQNTCQSLEDTAQQLREHRQTHESQLGAVEEALTDMQAELDAALTSHKAVQQAKDHAKAELALVEHQLLNDRAARDAQLQQHTSLRQKEYEALHHGALQRLQQWNTQLLHQQGPTSSPAVIGTPAVGGSVDAAAEDAADNASSSDTQQAAGTDGLSTSATDTGLTSTTPAPAESAAEASTAATAANLEQAHTSGANADAQEATSTAGVGSSSEAAASGPVGADAPADSSHKDDGKEPGVTDVTDLVDRFLSQDDTEVTLHQLEQESQAYLQELQERSATLQVTLEDLQLGRSLLHRQAEAAIKAADGQIKLNKEQYDQAGRLLMHVKASNF
ncbi:MAG: hypothetical protein FRX49_09651 [Trebouxia sp. A1-2]|nr:MAG: hypothetical protein FRX49_09651 [Trebouxia sp. A1-2]